jgi:GNAT superfamily N-acetyltransferase
MESSITPVLVDSSTSPQDFFSILPPDWQREIAPVWESYKASAKIKTLTLGNEVVGGGILFSTVSPDTTQYKEEALHWFGLGYIYIGFLFIDEKHRGKHYGSLWLQEVEKTTQHNKFWLTIDDYELVKFYEPNGFQLVKKISLPDWDEWVLIKN